MNSLAKASILVVDDMQINIEIIARLLEDSYKITSAITGKSALKAVDDNPPDLILLDIMMPCMDGYEVCRRLKKNPGTRDIPVVFLTSLADVKDKTKGFNAGAVDYIVKPFEALEVKARVATHIALKNAREALKNQNSMLEEKVSQRTKELFNAHERLKVLDKAKMDFLNLISHELRTPLTGLFGAGEVLGDEDLDWETRQELKEVFKKSSDRLLGILDEALLLAEINTGGENFQPGPEPVSKILENAVKRVAGFAESRGTPIGSRPGCGWLTSCDGELLSKAFAALIKTAVKFSVNGNPVTFSCELAGGEIIVMVSARGRTIPEEALPRFFEVFSIAEPITPGGDLGLSPPMAHSIIKLFQGSVTVENYEGEGVRFTVRLRKT